MLIIFLVVLGIIVLALSKSKNPNNNIIKKVVINAIKFILFFVMYYFVICFISMIPLVMMSNNSDTDSGLWAYSIILGMGLSPILSLITLIKLNKNNKKKNTEIVE